MSSRSWRDRPWLWDVLAWTGPICIVVAMDLAAFKLSSGPPADRRPPPHTINVEIETYPLTEERSEIAPRSLDLQEARRQLERQYKPTRRKGSTLLSSDPASNSPKSAIQVPEELERGSQLDAVDPPGRRGFEAITPTLNFK
jgi:hypothetical protein